MENDKKGACCSRARKTSRQALIRSTLAIETSYQMARQDLTTVKLDDNSVLRAHAEQNDLCRAAQSIVDRRTSWKFSGTPAPWRRGPGFGSGCFSFRRTTSIPSALPPGLRRLWRAAKKSASTVAGRGRRLRSGACKAQRSDRLGTSECG